MESWPPLLADPRVLQFSLLVIQEPSFNSFNNSTPDPIYTLFNLLHPCVEDSHVCCFRNNFVNPNSLSGDFSSPDYVYLRLKSFVLGSREIITNNIYRPQGTGYSISDISFKSHFSHFLAAPDNSDVSSLCHY